MLRVGLTGGLGSGKSTVAAMLARRGAHVLSSDEIGRELMQPGRAVYDAIVAQFGVEVVRGDGSLDRRRLAELGFAGGRLAELNRIVHPAVIAEQGRRIAEIEADDPDGVIVLESALLFEAGDASGVPDWRRRFDYVVLVTAPESVRVERFVDRALGREAAAEDVEGRRERLRADAWSRVMQQIPEARKAEWSDWVLPNETTVAELELQVERLWRLLEAKARGRRPR